MKFYENTYYHLFNRTNNEEALFRSEENYLYFLKKYRYYLDEFFETVGYCLMPTHFHFLVRVKEMRDKDVQHLGGVGHMDREARDKGIGHMENDVDVSYQISKAMQTLQSSYTKAINKRYDRHGSLFQAHYKAKPVSLRPLSDNSADLYSSESCTEQFG
jgi:putative transposase